MRALPLLVGLPLLLAGCIGATEEVQPAAVLDGAGNALEETLAFTAPLALNRGGYGYEPSIRVGPEGTLYATAHKASLTHEGTRLSSWLWYSDDAGATWKEMPSPGQAHDKLFAFEGDLAIDQEGRVYYVDTYAADNTLSRWQTTETGPAWEWTRPVHGTLGVDDRPWLDAHGDGIVYYLGNNGAAVAAPNNLLEDAADASRIWFYRSEDGGVTWTPGHGFPDTGWCGLAASPADDQTVIVGCSQFHAEAKATATVYASRDRGATWKRTDVAPYDAAPGPNFPDPALDRAGNAYHAWIDDRLSDDRAGRIHLSRDLGGDAWEDLDVTPFDGSFGMIWATGGAAGTVALTFYATEDVAPGEKSEWHPYLLLSADATAPRPTWTLKRLDDAPAGVGAFPPGDFFQNAIGPANEVHVIYQREIPAGSLAEAVVGGYRNDILHVRQTAGPNLIRALLAADETGTGVEG